MIIEESYQEDPCTNRIQVLANIAQIPKMVKVLNTKMPLIEKFLDEEENKASRKIKRSMNRPGGYVQNFNSFVKKPKEEEYVNPLHKKNSRKKSNAMVPVPAQNIHVFQNVHPQMDVSNIKSLSGAVFGRAFHEIQIKEEVRKFMFLVSDFEVGVLKSNIANKNQIILVDVTCKFDASLCEWSTITSLMILDKKTEYFMPIGHVMIQKPDVESFIVCFEWFTKEFGDHFNPKMIGTDFCVELTTAVQVAFPDAYRFTML